MGHRAETTKKQIEVFAGSGAEIPRRRHFA
jgi:hypothetical protein